MSVFYPPARINIAVHLKNSNCDLYFVYSYLDSLRFPALSVFWSRNAYFLLFMVFINLWDAPTSRVVTDRCRHVSGNYVLVGAFQNKSTISFDLVYIYCGSRLNILLWNLVYLVIDCYCLAKHTPITSIIMSLMHKSTCFALVELSQAM